jgi:DNA-directed RNA polymerase specialized sigma24 family protein
MASDGSITRCIALLREGEDAAAQVIWERYYSQLVRLAHMQLGSLSRRVVDEEDIALSALDRICRALEQGRYPDLADRHGLWRLLLQITARRVADQARYERRQRRGSGRVHGETEGGDPPRLCSRSLDEAADDAPTPEFAAAMADQCRRLLARLEDPRLQALAIAKMDGSANHEIAAEMGCSVRTVERRLKLIRDIWRDEEPE